jgi:hypothetical protein
MAIWTNSNPSVLACNGAGNLGFRALRQSRRYSITRFCG